MMEQKIFRRPPDLPKPRTTFEGVRLQDPNPEEFPALSLDVDELRSMGMHLRIALLLHNDDVGSDDILFPEPILLTELLALCRVNIAFFYIKAAVNDDEERHVLFWALLNHILNDAAIVHFRFDQQTGSLTVGVELGERTITFSCPFDAESKYWEFFEPVL